SVIDQPLVPSKTRIGKNCFIGAGACIQAGTILGDGCIVGANAVVRGVFEDHSVIVGVPGRVVKRFNRETGTWGTA
ncbi:MAG: DapH/DapD/GlmU-related protein, partial [Phenylobacterium sp.]|nr:DapH/DapD/GlmU-related protein [Phenylobacterium sp.]